MRISKLRKLVVLAVLLLVSTACQAGTPQAHSTPRPSAAPTVTPDAQRCARLAKVGFSTCPPTPDKLQVPPTTIKNATNGAVDDTTAQKWGRGFQRTEAYYRWAMAANSRDALTSGAFADPTGVSTLFGYDLRDIDMARAQKGTLIDQWEKIPLIQIVVVSDELQSAMRQQGLKPTQNAIAVTFSGPLKRSIRLPNGQETVLANADSSFQTQVLVWGAQFESEDLGTIWYENGLYGCEGSVVRVCNP